MLQIQHYIQKVCCYGTYAVLVATLRNTLTIMLTQQLITHGRDDAGTWRDFADSAFGRTGQISQGRAARQRIGQWAATMALTPHSSLCAESVA